MPVIVAPSTQTVPDGYTTPSNVVAHFVMNLGDVLTWGVSGSQDSSPGRTDGYGYYLYDDDTNELIKMNGGVWGPAVQTNYLAPKRFLGRLQLQIGGGHIGAPAGTAFGVFANLELSSTATCAYGTQRRFGIPEVLTLTPDELVNLLTLGGYGWMRSALGFLNYQNLNVESLCSSLPPTIEAIDTSTLSAGVATWTRIFHSAIWSQLCECVPGAPAPLPPSSPPNQRPPGWPPELQWPCDPADICTALVAIQQQLAAVLQTAGSNLELTTLLQRYEAPFAYVRGARHAGLTGTGVFPVPRCVGFVAEVTAMPDGLQMFTGAPTYISDLGWLSTLDGSGMLDEVRLTRQAQVWLPGSAQAALTLGYGLRSGVVADVVELYAEP